MSREQYIDIQLRGLDTKASWLRDDATQIAQYVRTLAATPSEDSSQRDKVCGSISAAKMALTEALKTLTECEACQS